jgi:glutaredoxin
MRTLPLALILALAACKAPAPTAAAEQAPSAPPPADLKTPDVRPGTDSLLFTFVEGYRVRVVTKIDEVPERVRERVLVTDLRMSAEDRSAHRYNYFADLTQPQADGSYPVSVVSRYDAAAGQGVKVGLPKPPAGAVVIYTAEWCGFCKKEMAWMDEQGVVYVKRDVEKQPGASAELQEKLKAAGVQAGGIPVTDWLGELVVGFNKPKLEKLLEEKPPAKKP